MESFDSFESSCEWCRTLLGRWEFWFKENDVEFFHVLYCGAPEGEWSELEALADEWE